MLSRVTDTLDRRLADVILARARRRWWLMSLIPEPWLRPAAGLAARRFRRSLAAAAIAAAIPVVGVILLAMVLL